VPRSRFLTGNKVLARQMESEGQLLGVPVVRFEGDCGSIPLSARRRYRRAEAIAVMNYWVMFNQNPVIDSADLLVIDDAHLAEGAASEGGTAHDAESGSVDVAFRGALAALLTGDAPAYQFLMGQLPDGPHRRYLLATEIEEAGQPAAQRVHAWTRVLEAPGDDAIAVQTIAALASLGRWPQQAEEMHDRGVLPDDAYQMLRAICQYRAGDPVMGLAKLRALADASALAAGELVRLIEERDGWAAAAEECKRQLRRWPAPQLTLRLLDLHGKNGNISQAEELARQVVPDPSFPDGVRLDLCEWYTARKGSEGSLAEAAAFAEQGLAIGDHPGLAWNLVKVLHRDGKITRARQALRRCRPEPVSEDETTLWMQLHLGVPLSPDDARTMIGIAERQPDGDFRDATIGLLAREVIFTSPEPGSPFPSDVTNAVTRLREQAESRPGNLLRLAGDDDETLRAALAVTQPDPVAYQALVRAVHQDRKGQADLARFARQPYAAVLLHRPAGIIPATDLRTGLRHASESAACRRSRTAGTPSTCRPCTCSGCSPKTTGCSSGPRCRE
jgi:hypothetical protein